jgi:ribosomal protein L4
LRNIDKVETLPVSDINAYEVLRPKRVLMTRAALDLFRAKSAAVKA